MKNEGICIDDALYNTFMELCTRFKKYERAIYYYNEMQLNDIAPTVITMTILIRIYG